MGKKEKKIEQCHSKRKKKYPLVKRETSSMPLILKHKSSNEELSCFACRCPRLVRAGEKDRAACPPWWKCNPTQPFLTEQFLISNHKNAHRLRPGNSPSKNGSLGNKGRCMGGPERSNLHRAPRSSAEGLAQAGPREASGGAADTFQTH